MKKYLVERNRYHGGIQKVYNFPNGYGASVICHDGSYGGPYKKNGPNFWELAVLDSEGSICYDTEITDDVIGHLNDPEVDRLLIKISQL